VREEISSVSRYSVGLVVRNDRFTKTGFNKMVAIASDKVIRHKVSQMLLLVLPKSE